MFETLTKHFRQEANNLSIDMFILSYSEQMILKKGNFQTHKEFMQFHNIKLNDNCVYNLYNKLKNISE